MKAIQFKQYGDANVLEINEVHSPTLQDNEILIENKAFGINPIDWKLRSGLFKNFIPLQFPAILGFEAAGIVKAVAPNVNQFKIGDRIYGHTTRTYAEEVVIQADQANLIPHFLTFEQAAALPSNSKVAYNALVTLGKLKQNQHVLILAGSGGVGTAAIQIAQYLGAHISTTVSTKNIDLVKNLGAHRVIDYTQTELSSLSERFDLILDCVGGTTQIQAFNLLNDSGLLISLVSDESAHFSTLKKDQKFIFSTGVDVIKTAEIHQLILNGYIKPVIDEVFSFSEISKAHIKSQFGHVAGKIVVQV